MIMKGNTGRAAQAVFLLAALMSGALSPVALAQEKAAKIDELVSVYHNYGQFNGSVLVAESYAACREPTLHQIDPGRAGGGEMQVKAGVPHQPAVNPSSLWAP